MTIPLHSAQPQPEEFETCKTVSFVPNQDASKTIFPDDKELLNYVAQRFGQDPDTVEMVPFAELEGIVLNEVDTNVTANGQPIPMDVIGESDPSLVSRVEPEPVSELGETVANELDSFDSPTAVELSKSAITYIVGEYSGDTLVRVIDSEETMTQLERTATGEPVGK